MGSPMGTGVEGPLARADCGRVMASVATATPAMSTPVRLDERLRLPWWRLVVRDMAIARTPSSRAERLLRRAARRLRRAERQCTELVKTRVAPTAAVTVPWY
ncbi:hypothetical protein GCM10028802_12950 [Terrabacter terrigena]